jgi:hypothetical protein
LGSKAAQGGVLPGGLDLTTPTLSLQTGALRDVLNFECGQAGGYARIQGYERFDGRAAPSAATYEIIQVDVFTNTPNIGDVITQATSGATGVVVAVVQTPNFWVDEYGNFVIDEFGNFVLGPPTVFTAVTMVTGTFDDSHAITTPGPIAIGNAIPITVVVTSLQNAQFLAAAADAYRAVISAVPGSGPVLGVVGMTFLGVDNVYAFRANIGGTAVAIYKASASGWVNVPLFNSLNFDTGSAQPQDGDVITQGGVTATIKRVMWQSGAWSGTAVGTFVVTNPAGGNFAAGAATSSSGGAFHLTGVQTPIVILPVGKYEFVKCNFSGQLVTRRIYGCDGVNKAFEFDGVTYAPITTGLSPDQPSHITFHKNFLFLSQASSIFYSGAGTPFKWDAVDGGGEIATGDEVTGMITLPGSQTTATLAVYMRGNTSFLYGIDPTTFNFVTFNQGMGAIPGSVQNLFDTFSFDNLGVITLKTTLNYGNFLPSTDTKNILPFIQQERQKITCSTINREKAQYRVFFSDGYGLWLTVVNSDYIGCTIVQFPNPVNCADAVDTSLSEVKGYFGSNDGLGFVYQLDKGTGFDGATLDAHITMAWDALRSPRILKRFRAASIEMQSNSYAEISFGYQLAYGSPLVAQPSFVPYATGFSGTPFWDKFVWDKFIWDGQTLVPTDVDMTGTGENVQVTLSSTTNYIDAYAVNSVIYQYTPRRGMRV